MVPYFAVGYNAAPPMTSTIAIPRVAVLLATRDGIIHIASQMESILAQSSCAVDIWVSDDESSDGTWEWLLERAANEPRVRLLSRPERFGNAARNFYRLLRDVQFAEYDFVALSDQDDIWMADKLAKCIELARSQSAAVVSSDVIAFWPNGRQRMIRKSQPQVKFDFLFESAGPGCTCLLSSGCATKFANFLSANRNRVNGVDFHDWMLYAWARAFGHTWHIAERPTMFYRQHARNEFGAHSGLAALRRRLLKVRSGWYRSQILAIANLVAGGPLYTPQCAGIVYLVAEHSIYSRLQLAIRVRELRRRMKDRGLLLLACVFGGI
jgi:rhamnosyltransferase